MSDVEYKAIKDRERALQAQHLIEHPLLKEAFETLEKAMIEKWIGSGSSVQQSFEREQLWNAINIVRKLPEFLMRVIQDGKVADAHLKKLVSQRPRAA